MRVSIVTRAHQTVGAWHLGAGGPSATFAGDGTSSGPVVGRSLSIPAAPTVIQAYLTVLVRPARNHAVPGACLNRHCSFAAFAWRTRSPQRCMAEMAGRCSRHPRGRQQAELPGTFVSAAAAAMSSARIWHVRARQQPYERIESPRPTAALRRFTAINEVVHALAGHARVVEQGQAMTSFPRCCRAASSGWPSSTKSTRAAERRRARCPGVAGAAARCASFRLPAHPTRHRAGGQAARADVLGERGERSRRRVLGEVTIGVKPQFESVTGPMRKLDGYRVAAAGAERHRWRPKAGAMLKIVPGFRGQLREAADGVADRERAGGPPTRCCRPSSDGLTTCRCSSSRLRPAAPPYPARHASTAVGATQTLMRRRGDWWITVVGDVPLPTAGVRQRLERRK